MSKEALSEKNHERIFRSEAGEQLSLREVVLRIKAEMQHNPDASYEIAIGSDSHAKLHGSTAFVTAIVVRRVGNGAVYFWTRREQRFGSMQDRIWREASLSITLAQELRSMVRDLMGDEVFWQEKIRVSAIHIDVGEDGPTRSLITAISGMVLGFGFEAVTKPYAYAASAVADRHT